MKIINPLLTNNILSILPRGYDSNVAVTVVLTDDDTREITNVIPSQISYISNDMLMTVQTPSLIEGDRLSFEVKQVEEIIFRGTIFVTQFNDTNYTINNDEFVVDTDTDSDSMKVYE